MKLYPHPITGHPVEVHFSKVHFTQREMNPIEVEILLLCLAKEFNKSHFSICGLDQAFSHMGIGYALNGTNEYKTLRSLHCVDYGAMSKELRMQIPDMCFDLLGISFSKPVEAIEEPSYAKPYYETPKRQAEPQPVKPTFRLKFWK